MKQVQHGHTSLSKGTREEAQDVNKWEKERKHGSNRSHEETQYKCWLWHYLGNPYFFVIGA